MKKIFLVSILALLLAGCNTEKSTDASLSENIDENETEYVYNGEKMYNSGLSLYKEGKCVAYLVINTENFSDALNNKLVDTMKNYDNYGKYDLRQVWIQNGQLKHSIIKINNNGFNINTYDDYPVHKVNNNFYVSDKDSLYILFSDNQMFVDEHSSYGLSRDSYYSKNYLKEKYAKEGQELIEI